jgi:hypothetical protein
MSFPPEIEMFSKTQPELARFEPVNLIPPYSTLLDPEVINKLENMYYQMT